MYYFFQKELSGVGGALGGGGGGGAASSKIGSLLRSGVSMCPTTLGTAPTEAACRVISSGISNRRNNLFEAAGVAEWLTHEWLSRMKYIVTSNINA